MNDPYAAGRDHLAAADPLLGELINERPDYDPHAALAELPSMDAFGVLLFQIIGQQISVPATRAILDRLVAVGGGRLPSPARLMELDPAAVASAGVSARKAATMRAAATVFVDEGLDRQRLAGLTDEEVERVLIGVPGIGPWTVQGFLVIALDRPDAFPAGDLGIRRAIRDLDGLGDLPSTGEAEQRAERWRPYRALAAGYLISWDAERRLRAR